MEVINTDNDNKRKKGKIGTDTNIVPTPYDDAFRTMMNDCIQLLIPVINEIFGKNYTGKEKLLPTPMSISLTSRTVRSKNALLIARSLSSLKITRKISIFLSVNLLPTTL